MCQPSNISLVPNSHSSLAPQRHEPAMPQPCAPESLVLSSPTGPEFGRTLSAEQRATLWRTSCVSVASAVCAIARIDLQTSHALCFRCDGGWYEVLARGANGDVFGCGRGSERGQQSGTGSRCEGREVCRGVEVDEWHR